MLKISWGLRGVQHERLFQGDVGVPAVSESCH